MTVGICTITTSELLKSARSVSQYKIKINNQEDRLVTVIGELHELDFDCNGKSLSVFDYCMSRALSNNNCRFLFEYNSNVIDKSRIGSTVVQEVFTSGPNAVARRCIGIDTRTDFLTRQSQTLLYNDEAGFDNIYGNNRLKIRDDFINTYDEEKLICNKDEPELLSYKNQISKSFTECDDQIRQHSEIYNSLNLKWAWAMVMDYSIMKLMLEPDDNVNEYVIVIGENHRKNIHDVVSTWSKDRVVILSDIKRHIGTCIDIKDMIKVC